MGPATIALAFGILLLGLIPARRLALAGLTARTIGLYVGGLWLLAMLAALVPGPARFLVPFLLILYLAPFITLRAGVARLRERLIGSGGPGAVRDVTPRPDDGTTEPPTDRDDLDG